MFRLRSIPPLPDAQDQRPRRCAGLLLHSDCATLRKPGETREDPGGVSAASFLLRFRAKTKDSAPPTQNCPPSLPPPKLVSPLAGLTPGLGLALTPTPLSAPRPQPSIRLGQK